MGHNKLHSTEHTDGTDDIQIASSSQIGLMSTTFADIVEGVASISGGLTQLDDRFVNVDGDTMTGILNMGSNILPTIADTYDLGSDALPFNEGHLNTVHLIPLSGANVPIYQEGTLFYDGANRVLKLYNDIPDVALDLGEENWVRIVNKTGVQINNSQVVYINGTQGNRPTVALADKNNELTADDVIGVATHDITNNSEGFITVFGVVREIDTSSWTEGDALYLGNNGALTNIEPLTPEHRVRVGYALNSTNDGQILVTIQNTGELKDLHDVLITSVADGDMLSYSQSISAWENTQPVFNGNVNLASGLYSSVQNISGGYTTTTTDNNIFCDGNFPLTLHDASTGFDVSSSTGQEMMLNNIGTETVNISGTIQGDVNPDLLGGEIFNIISNGTGWYWKS
jgi:hypothetical protein